MSYTSLGCIRTSGVMRWTGWIIFSGHVQHIPKLKLRAGKPNLLETNYRYDE